MNKYLPILAVETSGEICSVAVLLNENESVEMNYKQKHIHSKVLLLMIEQLLDASKISPADLHHVAVSNGPGSFTGLRIGLSAVKGFVFGLDLPIVQVPTFEALAYQLWNYVPLNRKFAIANTVNRDELYFAKFLKEEDGYKLIERLQIINKNKLEDFLDEEDLLYGNNDNFRSVKNVSSPSAEYIAKWSYFFGKDLLTYEVDYTEPNYLKDFVIKVKK